MNRPTTSTSSPTPRLNSVDTGDERGKREREHPDDHRQVATRAFDHGRHGIILGGADGFLRGDGTRGKNVIKIKYVGSRFTADIRITHALYVLRLATKPPSGYRATFISGFPYLEPAQCGALMSGPGPA